MQISFNQNSNINPKFTPKKYNGISFCAMKKSQFQGVNLAAVEKFKAPIEKFNVLNDLQNWAKEQAQKIAHTDFGGRQKETQIQRKAMIKEWYDYLTKENQAYTPVMSLLALNAAVFGLKPNDDKLPPVLNKGVLADVMNDLNRNLEQSPKQQFNLNKIYQTKLAGLYLETSKTDVNSFTGWVEIPSKENDPENFDSNVEKLKTLSHKNWCTKSYNAEPYLSKGDFHVYLENGNPKLGVRFVGDKIQEIQGELNNGKIPIDYFDEAKKHIQDNRLKLTFDAQEEVEEAKQAKKVIDKVRKDLKTAIETNDAKTIFEYFGIECKELANGNLEISHYKQPEHCQFNDVGIDENKLFEKVEKIRGWANFEYSQLTGLGNLKSIGKNAKFWNSQLTSLNNLKSIGGNAYFRYSQITSLGDLQRIGGNVSFGDLQITSLGNLQSIDGNVYFNDSLITSLGNLQSIGGSVDFDDSLIDNLGNLQSIGENAYITNSNLKSKDFKNIKIKGRVINKNSMIYKLRSFFGF